jgi:hypothetical protein
MNFLSFFQKVFAREIKWRVLGRGNYNKVFLTEDEFEIDELPTQWVCKKPIREHDEPYPLNDPERACRKWEEINPDYPAYLSPDKRLWFMPYLGKTNASDERTARAIIDIYRRTGNIIADGGLISNFVKFDNGVVCVDVDLAVRRNSISSELFFNEILSSERFDQFFESLKKQKRPKTLICIKVLFFLEDCLAGSEFDHQLMNFKLLNYCYYFASNGYVIDSTIYHNLCIISQQSIRNLDPECFHPLYLSKLPKCENYQELRTHLVNIYENYDEIVVQGDKKDISDEDEVRGLLGQLVEQVSKRDVFENHFFANLSKRTFFANAEEEANKELHLVPG